MTVPGDRPPWDPFGLLRHVAPTAEQVAALARPLAGAAGSLGALPGRTAITSVVELVRRRLVGRRLRLGTKERPLGLTVTSLQVTPDPVLLAAGQVDGMVLEVEDVTWGDLRFTSARAELRNVHTRPAPRPGLVAAPVDLEAVVEAEVLGEAVSRRTTLVELVLEEAGARVRLARRPEWGWVAVEPAVEGSTLFLRPAALGSRHRSWALARRLPPVHLNLDLPPGVRMTGITLGTGQLRVRFRVDEWRLDHAELLAFAAAVPPSR